MPNDYMYSMSIFQFEKDCIIPFKPIFSDAKFCFEFPTQTQIRSVIMYIKTGFV